MNELMSLWAIQEHVLQSYRLMFFTAESVLFGAAMVVEALGRPWGVVQLSILGLFLAILWVQTCRYRARDVSWVQAEILKAEHGERPSDPVNRFKAYQRAAQAWQSPIDPSPSRIAFGYAVPVLFAAWWVSGLVRAFGLL